MKISLKLVLVLSVAGSVATAQSQSTSPPGAFDPGQNAFGAVIGFGNVGGASASLGGRFEHAIKTLPSLGNGLLGFSLDADFYHYSDALNSGISFTYIPVGASANYHFRVEDRRWDPFLGAGLGYLIANASSSGGSVTAASSIYVITRAGVRYFYGSRTALQADIGAGAATLSVGIIWKP